MVNRILSAIGWIGMALVVAAVGIRFGLPAREQYAYYLAWGGLVCVLVYTLGFVALRRSFQAKTGGIGFRV